ncbi:unnamed protein product [Brachionus calyciflorus]|uniref:Uncharacterized protein n=1 Tax=Brachionus calyciflorus TaxID=104777 RepID=A0A814E5V4_9BILA|nr:unnamed protein product [Brachionus calyciflorus]
MQTYPPQVDNEQILNNYAQEYLNTVKENRSQYGNFVDNNLTYDPYKEQKSVYNVVYETDGYNPWGKPGGGAPKIDQSGNLKTKIVGTLRWNLNGETEEDRQKRMAAVQKNQNNALLYKKNFASPQNSPRLGQNEVRTSTTYNYNYRDPYLNANQQSVKNTNLPPLQNSYQNSAPSQHTQNQPQQQYDMTRIEQEAYQRNFQKKFINTKQGDNDYNKISNKLFIDNKPSPRHPNNPYWFGRAGPGFGGSSADEKKNNRNGPSSSYAPISAPVDNSVQYYDVRRRNLLDALENRIQNPNFQSSSNNKFVN